MKNTTYGNSPAAIQLDKMLSDEFLHQRSKVSRVIHAYQTRFNAINEISERSTRNYFAYCVKLELDEYLATSPIPDELKSFVRNVILVHYRNVVSDI